MLSRLWPLFGLWANLHGGLPAAWASCAGALESDQRWRTGGAFILAAIASLAATLLNPYGSCSDP